MNEVEKKCYGSSVSFPLRLSKYTKKKISFTSSAGKNERSIEFTKLI